MNYIPLDPNLDQEFKYIRREFSVIEAMFSYSLDIARDSEKSILSYSVMWSWSRNRVKRFIEDIRKPSGYKKDSKRTVKGQAIRFIDKVMVGKKDSKRTVKGQAIRKKQTSNPFMPPTLLEVENYFFDNGYTKQSGNKAWKYYTSGNWKDAGGKQVLSWKQKMRGVWFKDSNKRPADIVPINDKYFVDRQAEEAKVKKRLPELRKLSIEKLTELSCAGDAGAFFVMNEKKKLLTDK